MSSGAVGYVNNEPGAPPLPFIVFPGPVANPPGPTQTLNFTLPTGFTITTPAGFQGTGQAACALASATPGDSCYAIAGSPFLLITNGNGTTTVDLDGSGTVADPNNASVSTWLGVFTTQLTGTPTSVYNAICPAGHATCDGSIATTYSFSGTVTMGGVPEPGTIGMMFVGAGLAMLAARRRRANR